MRPWRHNGLGALLLAALCLSQPAGTRAADLGPEEAKELERLLTELNFDPGPVDGVIDGRTRAAISLYQEFAALAVDGEPGRGLLVELRQVVQAFAEINAAKAAAASAREPEPAPEPEPEVVAQPEPEPEPEPEVAVEPEPEPEVAVEPEPEPEVAVEPEPEPEVAAQPEPDSRPEPEPDTASQRPSKSGFNLDNMIARLVEKDGVGDAPPAVVPDRELVLAVQHQLARIGFDPGPLDGQVGARTVQAIEAYQGARGLPVDGRPSRELLDRLALESRGATGADQTSRIATNHAVAQLLGAADGEKLSPAGADATQAASQAAPPAPPAAPPVAAPTMAAPRVPILDGYDAFEKAFVASEAGDYARAIALYSRAIEGGDLELTYLADAFFNRANVRSHTKEYDFAIADYGAAIVNKPEFPGAYHNRGFAFEASGRHNRAMADFIKARALGMGRLPARTPDQPPPLR